MIRVATIALAVTLSPTLAAAQAAPLALDSFRSICQANLDQPETSARFAADGWTLAPDSLSDAFTQDIVDPDAEALFVRDVGAGKVLAATMSEKRGLLGTRTRSVCFIRVFVETPDQMRADFRSRMGAAPDTATDSDEVRADSWSSLLAGQVIGLRAVKLPEGYWMVTAYRVLTNA